MEEIREPKVIRYLRIEGDDFSFVTPEFHKILESDIQLTDSDYNYFFELQSEGSRFEVNPEPKGKGLFDYLVEIPFKHEEPGVVPPTLEERMAALEAALMGVL